jgi:hypothetical protein
MRVNRSRDVDRWFEEQDHPLDAAMRRAREIILGADGRVTESIKWKTPTFAFEGNIASFNPSMNTVSVMCSTAGRRSRARTRGSKATGSPCARCASPTWPRSRKAGRTSSEPSGPGATGRPALDAGDFQTR